MCWQVEKGINFFVIFFFKTFSFKLGFTHQFLRQATAPCRFFCCVPQQRLAWFCRCAVAARIISTVTKPWFQDKESVCLSQKMQSFILFDFVCHESLTFKLFSLAQRCLMLILSIFHCSFNNKHVNLTSKSHLKFVKHKKYFASNHSWVNVSNYQMPSQVKSFVGH